MIPRTLEIKMHERPLIPLQYVRGRCAAAARRRQSLAAAAAVRKNKIECFSKCGSDYRGGRCEKNAYFFIKIGAILEG